MYVQRAPLGRLPTPATPTTAQLRGLPDGKAGTLETLRIMRQLVRAAIRDPAQKMRILANQLIAGLPPRAYPKEVQRLHEFVRDQIRYVKDPVGVELVTTPEKTVELGYGDCDDKSVLLAALLESIGHPARFLAVGLNGGPFSHVLTQTKLGPQWISAETILPVALGWHPQGVTSTYLMHI